MDYAITFLEGVVTFISPCLLPMLPLYVAYFAGDAGNPSHPASTGGAASEADQPARDADAASRRRARTRRTVISALGFIIGFSLLFCAMGALAGSIGSLLVSAQPALNAICGAIVMVLGLNYLGILRIPLLQRTLKPETDMVPRGFASSLLFGMVFAVGWTPCVGAFLGSALSLAATSGHALGGIALLLCYSLGLGLPFFLAAILIDQLEGAFSWVKAHYRIIDRLCGALLVVLGALMATGLLGTWMNLLASW